MPRCFRSSATLWFSPTRSSRSLIAAALMLRASTSCSSGESRTQAPVDQEVVAVPHMVGERAVLLHLEQLRERDQRQRVLLPVDDLGLQRGVDLVEVDTGGCCPEALEQGGPHRADGDADLEALEVVGRVDRMRAARDLAEAVV